MTYDLFDGATFSPERDGPRLNKTQRAVLQIMQDGEWHTLNQLHTALRFMGIRASEASISARLRDLRKPRFGGYTIERKHGKNGLWFYRMKGSA